MLETVDFSLDPLAKSEYKVQCDDLMERMVVLQQRARVEGVGLVVLFEGWNGAGKGSRISDLMYHMDARATSVHVMENLDVAAARAFTGTSEGVTGFYPVMQEFWKSLGERGTITFFDRGWYTAAIQHLLYTVFGDISFMDTKHHKSKKAARKAAEKVAEYASYERHIDTLARFIESTADFERQLVDDGYVVVKFFVHVRQEAQRERLERLHADPSTRWRVSPEKLARVANYQEAFYLYDRLLSNSDFDFAPWTLINGEDKRAANLHIAETLVNALSNALEAKTETDDPTIDGEVREAPIDGKKDSGGVAEDAELGVACDASQDAADQVRMRAEREAACQSEAAPRESRFPIVADCPNLDEIDHTLIVEPVAYKAELKAEQRRLNRLEMEMYQRRIPLMIMYEGWDAAGKGGNIKRVAQALDARSYTIFPSPAPTKPELMHPHLWRYWTRLPKAGHVGIYDRSWYGRVLVERVEGFATPSEWSRAYDEINEFEREMIRWGAILLKFWVDVSQDEQLRRFEDRASDPAKQWKITDDDWRNREKYPQYKAAIEDMFRLTSTPFAPWIVLESDNKRYARVKALKLINDALEARLREK